MVILWGMWDPSTPTRDWTHAPCSANVKSEPLDLQGNPLASAFKHLSQLSSLPCLCCRSATKLCLILCDPMDCSTPGFSVPHYLLEFAQTHVCWASDAIQPSHPLLPASPLALHLSQHQGVSKESTLHIRWPKYWSFKSSSVLPMNIQGWFPLGLTRVILLSKGLSRVFSSRTIWKHQFFGTHPSLWSNSQFRSVAQSCLTLCDPMDHSTPGSPVYHQLPESTQTHLHAVGDAIQPSHPLSSPSPLALNLSQHQGLFKWVSSSHQVAKVLEFQLQHQSFQWTPRTDFL